MLQDIINRAKLNSQNSGHNIQYEIDLIAKQMTPDEIIEYANEINHPRMAKLAGKHIDGHYRRDHNRIEDLTATQNMVSASIYDEMVRQ